MTVQTHQITPNQITPVRAPSEAPPAPPQNLFGICHRVGEDFGFNPLWLRLAFASALILNPVAVIAAYFALGAIVVTSRIVFPNRKPAAAAPVTLVAVNAPEATPQTALPLAA